MSWQSYHDNIERDEYIINPEHQRDVVHDNNWQSDIISSAVEFGLIPEVIYHPVTTKDGIIKHENIDGKQRSASIMRFMNNELKVGGLYFNQYSPKHQNWFKNFKVAIRISSRTLTKYEIATLFTRLQHNKRTSCGESLNAHIDSNLYYTLQEISDELDSTVHTLLDSKHHEHTQFYVRTMHLGVYVMNLIISILICLRQK